VRDLRGRGCTSVFTCGFCFGGRNSWLAAASGHGLAGAVGFYGFPTERNGVLGPAERAAEIECPILALQAGADQNITNVENTAFEEALTAAGVTHELVVYDGAPHSFFDRKHEEFAEASEDAWRRVLAFVERYSS
jgi:carboxymethylenebutenolidase